MKPATWAMKVVFPRPVGADDGVGLVLEHVEVDAVGRDYSAETAGEAPNGEKRSLHPPALARSGSKWEGER